MIDRLSSIPAAITQIAITDPDHRALRMSGRSLSYGEFEARSNSFANMLADKGVTPGDRVGLYAHKSLELFVALFGTMKAGAVYVPVNPDAPAAYVQHILEDAEITHLVIGKTTRKTAMALAPAVGLELVIGVEPAHSIVSSLSWDAVWSYPTAPPPVEVALDDLAYIIFTSGSTGRPKGIAHTHRSGLAYGQVAAITFGFASSDRIANHPPLNFDLSLFELWGGVVAGSTIVVIPEAHARLPASFTQMLADEQVTIVNAVPFALVQMLHRGALDERDLSHLRWVAFGGEVFPTKDLRALMQRLPGARFVNVYGPAEVNGVTYSIVPELPADTDEPILIGGLYPGMQALVLDDGDHEVALGETGELLIHSPTQMVGYWRQPELTAKCTYHRNGPDGTPQRWHRTGDLVQRLSDGQFRLIGRKDRMVKTRGNRVELDEVETALISHEAVEHVAVYAVPDGEGSVQIEAAVTVHDTGKESPTEVELMAHAATQLPRYAVPRVVKIVNSLPRTSTGKADRVALVAQAQQGAAP